MANQLFSAGDSFELTGLERDKRLTMFEASGTLEDDLKQQYQKTYFRTNFTWFLAGTIASILLLALTFSFIGGIETVKKGLVFSGFLTVWSLGCGVLCRKIYSALKKYFISEHVKYLLQSGLITVLSIIMLGAEVYLMMELANETSAVGAIVLVLLGGMNALFYYLLKAPSKKGIQVITQIEAYKQYLSRSHDNARSDSRPPTITDQPEDDHLPYTIALNLEHTWVHPFVDHLKKIFQADAWMMLFADDGPM